MYSHLKDVTKSHDVCSILVYSSSFMVNHSYLSKTKLFLDGEWTNFTFDGKRFYPLVNVNIAIENGPVEIVALPLIAW